MDSDIAYLNLLREDLREAGVRARLGRLRDIDSPTRSGPRAIRSRKGGRPGLARLAAAAALLAVAGLIGAVAAGGGSSVGDFAASVHAPSRAPSRPASGGLADVAKEAGGAGVATSAPAPPSQPSVQAQSRAADRLTEGRSASNAAGADGASASFAAGGIPEVSKVIETADLSIVVAPSSFPAKFQAATEIAERLGGFVEASNEQSRSGHLVMRVPARAFNEARRELKGLGIIVTRETIDGHDVTAQFVDLKARLEIMQARKDALVRLLHEARSLETILRLQNVVDDVLTRIEELKGEINLINDQTSKATISLTMREKGVLLAPVVDKPSLGSALARGVAGFLSVLYAIVVGLGYLVPVAVVALLAWFGVRTARRRQEQSAAAADA